MSKQDIAEGLANMVIGAHVGNIVAMNRAVAQLLYSADWVAVEDDVVQNAAKFSARLGKVRAELRISHYELSQGPDVRAVAITSTVNKLFALIGDNNETIHNG